MKLQSNWIWLLAAAGTLAGCSSLEGEKIDYRSNTSAAPSLEVPPDLTQLSKDSHYVIPGQPVTASGFHAGARAGTASAASPAGKLVAPDVLQDVRLERIGTQRWLVVGRPVERVWESVRDFWQENGFVLAAEQPKLGYMETEWAENRAKLPQDFIRNTLGKLFDSIYSTGERDKFRTRVERGADGTTEITITHRGLIETLTGPGGLKETTGSVWQPRPSDPELENEFLRRLMVRLGAPQDTAKATVAKTATSAPPAAPRVQEQDNLTVIALTDDFERAWRRVGQALDRIGFTVEDRDRSRGLYFVRTVEPNKAEPGFFSKLLGGGDANSGPVRSRILVEARATGGGVNVSVRMADGTPDASANGKRILKILADELR